MKKCLNCGKEITGKKYCNNQCQHDYQYHQYIMDWKSGIKDGSKGKLKFEVSRHVRRYLFEKYNNRCCKCGWRKKNPITKLIPLQINHIDGNSRNHKEENLELICPNCHSLTETYMALNRGNGDKERKQYHFKCYNEQIDMTALCEYCKNPFSLGPLVSNKKKYCSPECAKLASRKVTRPTAEELSCLLKKHSMVELGRMFGVSDNAVRKWMKIYKLI